MSDICDVREHGARGPTRAPVRVFKKPGTVPYSLFKSIWCFLCAVLGRQGSRSCGFFHAKMRGTRRTTNSDRSKPALLVMS